MVLNYDTILVSDKVYNKELPPSIESYICRYETFLPNTLYIALYINTI